MYAPYGEQRLNQQPFAYEERFTFTGKERDAETGYDYFGARNYLSALSIWGAVDPLADKNISNSGYAYCNGNPLKYIDPDGNVIESIWDALWVTIDIASIAYDLVVGDTQQAQLDAASLATDAIALVIPGVPAVGGVARATTRLATKTDDAAKAMQRGIQSEKRVLNEMGLEKNTKKFASQTFSGESVNVIPDAVQDGVMYEIKDTKAVYNTKQIQGEINAAKEAECEFKIVTGEHTHISNKLPQNIEIINRPDLGPQ